MNATIEGIEEAVTRLGIERDQLLDRFFEKITRQLLLSGWQPHELIWSLSHSLEELGTEWLPTVKALEERVIPEALKVESTGYLTVVDALTQAED